MAIANCWECGKQVSTDAKVCPNCGARKPSKPASPIGNPKGGKPGTPRWLKIFLSGIAGIFVIAAALGGFTQSAPVQPKSQLALLCEEREKNVGKFKKYSDENNFAYASDVDNEIRKIDKKLSAYPDADMAKACGFYRAPAATEQTAKQPIVESRKVLVGCDAAPLEIFSFGKTYGESELRKQFLDSCRVKAGTFESPVIVEWSDKRYLIEISKEVSSGGEARFRISSMKSM